MRIGIVGAENSHTTKVAQTLNVQKACGPARVVVVWGETEAFARKAARIGRIPRIVKRPEEMIGQIDAVMVDHRHAKYHAAATFPFIEAGIPAFVDKPFSYTVREGGELLKFARKKRVPITSFSVLPEQEGFRKDLLRQIRTAGKITSIWSTGPCKIRSKWGGMFYYGIHQVDSILKAFGGGIATVEVIKGPRGNSDALAVMKYRDGGPIVSMQCVANWDHEFAMRAVGTRGAVEFVNRYDANMYLAGIRKFLKMFRTGACPHTDREILEPIAVLEALNKSVKSGRPVRVAKLPCY